MHIKQTAFAIYTNNDSNSNAENVIVYYVCLSGWNDFID